MKKQIMEYEFVGGPRNSGGDVERLDDKGRLDDKRKFNFAVVLVVGLVTVVAMVLEKE